MSHEPLNLDDDGEWAGECWLPEEPDHKGRQGGGFAAPITPSTDGS